MWITWPSRALTFPEDPATRPSRSISRAAATTSARKDTGDRLLVGRPEHAGLRDDRAHELGWGHVEGQVEGRKPLDHLAGIAFLDRDVGAARGLRVERRKRCRHVEG